MPEATLSMMKKEFPVSSNKRYGLPAGGWHTFKINVSNWGICCTIDRFNTKTIGWIGDGISNNCNIADSRVTVNGNGNPVS